MNLAGFYKITLTLDRHLFDELSNSIEFEKITNGRVANNLVYIKENRVPIVRTTSQYTIPAQNFLEIHQKIIKSLHHTIVDHQLTEIPIQQFNHALIEVYDSNYTKMGFHSGQCLDIENHSFIAIFSCYEHPDELHAEQIRKLKIKDKTTGEEFEFSLTHHSVILFSTQTNAKFKHKIVLERNPKLIYPSIENKWLGITFRTSKTYIEFKENVPFFNNGVALQLANEEQQKEFLKYRGEENKNLNFDYPFLNYTMSFADTVLPKTLKDDKK